MLALIRHGQTDLNLQGRLQGSSDWPLNATGIAQAHAAVDVLRETGTAWSLVVSSPLQRARRTAEIIAEGLGIELGAAYPDLVERDYGALEGDTEEQVERLWPGKSEPSVETLDSVVARGRRALDAIGADFPGRDVVVVCHGTIIRYTLSDLVGYKVPAIDKGSVSLVDASAEALRVVSVNGADPAPAPDGTLA
jgi:uncharacterized phosphatase